MDIKNKHSKNIIKIGILVGLLNYSAYSQSGCTDPAANNFNSLAVTNDGSCTYNVTNMSVHAKGSISMSVTESSGLVFTDGMMWTHNDSGNPNNIFKVDTANGTLLQTVTITNFPNVDWEDITADANYIYISDAGNNNGTRTDLKILKVDKSQFITNTLTAVNATAQAINFSYSDQTSFVSSSTHNFDCESIISIGSSLYIFTKDRGDMQTRVYKLSKTPGTYTVSPYTSYNVNGLITGADYNPQTNEVALIGYKTSHLNSFMYFLNDFTGDLFFSGNKRRIEIGNSVNDWQTEGITYINGNELFLSCETSYTPATIYRTCKSSMVVMPTGIREFQNNSNQIEIYPNPSAGSFQIKSNSGIEEIEILSLEGKVVYSKKSDQNNLKLELDDILNNSGYYLLKIHTNGNVYFEKLLLNYK